LFRILVLFALAGFVRAAVAQDEPPLPPGVESDSGGGESDEPPLPPGVGTDKPGGDEPALPPGVEGAEDGDEGDDAGEPALPPGIDEPADDSGPEDAEASPFELPFTLNGFFDMRGGFRTGDARWQDDMALGETRLQLEAEKMWQRASLNVTVDFLYDGLYETHRIDLERGTGWLDLRRAVVSATPVDFMDVKVGRQILTWGTGDLIFVNDMFPKDWTSFFIGRDVEYLKAPSDAVKMSFFTDMVNADIVYTPAFDADRFISGRRVSFWNDNLGRHHGRQDDFRLDTRTDWFTEDEIALRLFRTFTEGPLSGWEAAVYGYNGYWKSPAGFDPVRRRFTFPGLVVYGASLRGKVGPGIGNVELGYYDSRDDRAGDNPLIRNSEMRYLVGYEQELATKFTGGIQYYVERMMDYDDYTRTLPRGAPQQDRARHWVTVRLTKQLMQDDLTLSLFSFYSPNEDDAYLRPKLSYKFSDRWTGEVGGNVFFGEDPFTFFGQFEDASNVYMSLRYSF
jgi:hypothetical protein